MLYTLECCVLCTSMPMVEGEVCLGLKAPCPLASQASMADDARVVVGVLLLSLFSVSDGSRYRIFCC